MPSGIDRTEILRRDCPTCRGKGYVSKNGAEEPCEACSGMGLLEKEVPFKFDGPRTPEDLAEVWGVPIEEVTKIDQGHSAGD